MNRQEAYDTVVRHLFTQGKPSRDAEGCKYRGPNGTKCAIGVLIDDDKYSEDMEGSAAGDLSEYHYRDIPRVIRDNAQLMAKLQTTHDFCELNPDGTFMHAFLYERLKNTARDYKLKTTTLEEFANV